MPRRPSHALRGARIQASMPLATLDPNRSRPIDATKRGLGSPREGSCSRARLRPIPCARRAGAALRAGVPRAKERPRPCTIAPRPCPGQTSKPRLFPRENARQRSRVCCAAIGAHPPPGHERGEAPNSILRGPTCRSCRPRMPTEKSHASKTSLDVPASLARTPEVGAPPCHPWQPVPWRVARANDHGYAGLV